MCVTLRLYGLCLHSINTFFSYAGYGVVYPLVITGYSVASAVFRSSLVVTTQVPLENLIITLSTAQRTVLWLRESR